MKKTRVLANAVNTVASAVFFLASADSFSITVTELQQKMAASESALESVQFGYTQVLRSALTPEVRESSGTAYFKKPKQLRIEQAQPETQLIVSSGKFVFIYTPRFNQVVKDSWKRWSGKNIFFPGMPGFSEAFERLKKDYRWNVLESSDAENNQTIWVRLSRDSAGEEQQLNLWVDGADFIPRKTELVSGTLTLTTRLLSMQINPELKPDFFRFQKPARAEVISVP